jgi:lysophospholipase L1-like esterase
VAVIDFHDELEEPAGSGLMGAELTADGDHPSPAGAQRLGELVARELSG